MLGLSTSKEIREQSLDKCLASIACLPILYFTKLFMFARQCSMKMTCLNKITWQEIYKQKYLNLIYYTAWRIIYLNPYAVSFQKNCLKLILDYEIA